MADMARSGDIPINDNDDPRTLYMYSRQRMERIDGSNRVTEDGQVEEIARSYAYVSLLPEGENRETRTASSSLLRPV